MGWVFRVFFLNHFFLLFNFFSLRRITFPILGILADVDEVHVGVLPDANQVSVGGLIAVNKGHGLIIDLVGFDGNMNEEKRTGEADVDAIQFGQ